MAEMLTKIVVRVGDKHGRKSDHTCVICSQSDHSTTITHKLVTKKMRKFENVSNLTFSCCCPEEAAV